MPAIVYKNKDGKRLPSVTTILGQWGISKGALIGWAYKKGVAGEELYGMEEAQAGTCAHDMIECDIKGKKFDPSQYPVKILEDAQGAFQSYLKWKKTSAFKPIETEVSLVSEKHQVGGTLDCVGTVLDELTIVDWKTSKDVYEDYILQCAAYVELWNESYPDHPVKGFHILRVGKEIAMFAHHAYEKFPGAFEAFLHLRALYDLHKTIKKLK